MVHNDFNRHTSTSTKKNTEYTYCTYFIEHNALAHTHTAKRLKEYLHKGISWNRKESSRTKMSVRNNPTYKYYLIFNT